MPALAGADSPGSFQLVFPVVRARAEISSGDADGAAADIKRHGDRNFLSALPSSPATITVIDAGRE